jgi:hypothetical protein
MSIKTSLHGCKPWQLVLAAFVFDNHLKLKLSCQAKLNNQAKHFVCLSMNLTFNALDSSHYTFLYCVLVVECSL